MYLRPLCLGLFCFQVYGASAGGGADELRLKSTNDTFINLRAHGGSLDFVGTKVKTGVCVTCNEYICTV